MSSEQISRYVWLVDLLTRHERLSRKQISDFWMQSDLSDGNPLPERTFFNYRRNIEEIFHIDILCDRDGLYYIDGRNSPASRTLTNWLLDSYAVNQALKVSDSASEWVEVEDVPSARSYLPTVLEAIGANSAISFSYLGFNRSRAELNISFYPYFLKRYKQRWYMIGLKVKSGEIRTYALDRIKTLSITSETFQRPADLSADDIFGNIIGISESRAPVRTVRLKTTPIQAKYFRALPFHSTQTEEIGDGYSIFSYRLKLNYELVHEILSYGADVKVLEPRELRVMVKVALADALRQYE